MEVYFMRLKVIAALALFTLVNITAWGIDLTGTWEGKQACQYFDGSKTTQNDTDVLTVSQFGDEFYFFSVLVDETYHGRIIEDANHPEKSAQAVFVECDTTQNSEYQELGRATKLQNLLNGSALFKATSNFFQEEGDGFSLLLGTCIWTYHRVDTSDPNIGSCFEAQIRAPKASSRRRR
jgi:hypothetical protein